ncbi:class I adenylate-forming enzyme family protein [Sphingomonas bacterium]|uniref:class I adenylate-forming enzyme family protein n=1 Tax=Sphingomonas bacterium TaxID=1895847 RepID=UPI00157516AC|nr:AMP-binding protein [Sphingomonas bacterium]
MKTLVDLLERAEAEHGERIAVSTHDRHLTYRQLFDRSRRLAGAIASRGVRPGERVAIIAPNGFRYLEVNFACALAGAVLVPLNTRLAPAELGDILERVDCQLVFRSGEVTFGDITSIGWHEAAVPDEACGYERALAQATPIISASPATAETLAQIFFTSGTTGQPKGVCLTHGNLLASGIDAIERLDFANGDVWLHSAPMFHLVDAFAIWGMTLAGGAHVAGQFDAAGFGALVERERITKTSLPPTLLDWISRQRPDERHDLSSLALISYGGSPMQDAVYKRCRAALGCQLLQAYGLTEGSGFVCHEQAGDNPDPNAAFDTVGRPTRHVEIALLDDDGGTVAAGMVGEFGLRGARLFQGYWNDPEATRAVQSSGWYRTGDLGLSSDAGLYQVVGRKKEMIISGGENVYPAEVVNALLSHPAVIEAAVFGVADERWGEQVRAVVHVPADAPRPSAEELTQHCRSLIAGYKTPKHIAIWPDPLPKTGAGKIATAAIKARIVHEIGRAS